MDNSVANQTTIRWNATNKADGSDAQFAVVLTSTGTILFHYGANNLALTPTVGVSSGNVDVYTLGAYDGQASIENANSLSFQRVVDPGPQWASSVIGFSSQFSTGGWSAAQTLGAPNTFSYGDFSTAWAPSGANVGTQFVTVGYAVPVYADGVTVRETNSNGFVTRIDVLDTQDQYRTVWTGTDPSLPGTPVDFFVSFARTNYLVKGVKVFVDTNKRTDWEEIDAIRLHGTAVDATGLVQIPATNLTTNNFYNYSTKGIAQNWKSDDNFWTWTLPFSFPYYGTNYTTAYVSSNGFIQFGTTSLASSPANTNTEFQQMIRIAGLWDDLTTAGSTDNIFLDTSVAGQATVRWDATNKVGGGDVNFAITIFSNGSVRTEYGPGNKQLTPTIGMSRGNNRDYSYFSGYDGQATLTNVLPTQTIIAPGITDMGAYEFRGSSNDTSLPQIAFSTPSAIQSNGVLAGPIADVRLTFTEEMNPIDARSPAAYELRGAGINGLFNDADDIVYVLTPGYTPGQNTVVLVPSLSSGALPGGTLPTGLYRVTVLANITSSLHDLSGNRLDGNGDGNEGDNYVRQFKVVNNTSPIMAGTNALPQILSDEPDATNPGMLVSDLIASQITDPDGPAAGIAIASASSSSGVWQYALDGTTFQSMLPKLAGGKRLLLAADSDTRVRFKPNAGFVGQANDLTLSAWDRADELAEGLDVLANDLSAKSLGSQIVTATITVAPRNNAPTDVQLSGSTVAENLAAGATVGTLSSVDSNAGDTFTYQLVAGSGDNDNAQFEIVSGVVKTKSSFNFETRSTYSIRVRTTDQGGLSSRRRSLSR